MTCWKTNIKESISYTIFIIMGSTCSMGCCGDRVMTEIFVDPLVFQDSQSYRANFVHHEAVLESIEQVNLRGTDFDDMDKINKLLANAEQRIVEQLSISSKNSQVSNRPLKKQKNKNKKRAVWK
jgi:hypothetical protein